MIFVVLTTTVCCVLSYDFSLPNIKRNLNNGRDQPQLDVGGSGHNVETSGWKAMYSSRGPVSSGDGGHIFKSKETKVENVAPYSDSPPIDGAIYKRGVHTTYNKETLDRRLYDSDNENSENKNNNHASNKSNGGPNLYGYVPSDEPEVVVVMPSSQFKTEVPSANQYHHSTENDSIKQYNDQQISLEDVDQDNSYRDKIVADSFRVPRRYHPYNTASSMYSAQENLFVAPRAFQVDQLPSTPQLNAIMNRAMAKVKHLLHELEEDKGMNC